ncbi:MAG: glucose-1-phosphate adenylyltransferase [Ardenticatenaceae bacterium]|nr:glucose-1-phosphate adenylyltransferase [Anaerolineales bacterium]MCB8918401.1 glucose-1-phosphate adenylyltransferase [Ardenticatenaceae bacterium]
MRMKDVLGLILGGGAGTRLYPLTRDRAKPAVPLAGKYRLIDIPMSNCFNAGIEKIAIMTQFNSVSLHRHIYTTYARDVFAQGWVQILAAEQTPEHTEWYQGTADAVRKQLVEIREAGAKYVLILAGDHLYRMDYRRFLQFHEDSEADVTIAVQPVGREAASSLGILKLNPDYQITEFIEKPKTDAQLDGFESWEDAEKPYMASMGIYVFQTKVLEELLSARGDDFGKDIIPAAMKTHRVMGYIFNGYWEDIGTIRRFYEVNLQMASPNSPFDFYSPDHPIYTHPRFLPGCEVHGGHMHNVLMAEGVRIYDATVRYSVVGLRSLVNRGVTLHRTVLMGADYYETEAERKENRRLGRPDVGIGPGCVIEGAIIDKNARIGRRVVIRMTPNRPDEEHDNWVARDGIVIVPKNAIIPDSTVI